MSAQKQKLIQWFSEVNKDDIVSVGGKGANLGEMIQADFPVPPGFIVTAYAYFQFIKEAQLQPKIEKILRDVNCDDARKLQNAASRAQQLIIQAPVPKAIAEAVITSYLKLSEADNGTKTGKQSFIQHIRQVSRAHLTAVAVRSSATAEDLPQASFAGQQATFLNVRGEANVVHAVRKTWASLFTARAIFYRHDQGFDHFKVGIAIPIQKMIQSESSGVMFTINPVNNDKHTLVVEAIWGLGELIVQGAVTPDHFEIDKHTLAITNSAISRQRLYMPSFATEEKPVPRHLQIKQKLPNDLVIELARIGKRLERHYYFPQDVEWAYENKTLYIVQTRPITTLKDREVADEKLHKQLEKLRLILTGSPASPGIASGHVKIIKSPRFLHKIEKGDILVAEQTNPDYVPGMKKASGIVTAKGGRTSHAAIVSRELGTPAVVGAEDALKKLKDDMEITVDGGEGKVYRGMLNPHYVFHTTQNHNGSTNHLKTATKVYVNLAEVERAEEVSRLPVDGVGLLRAEFMLANIGVHPRWIIHQRKQKEYIDKLAEQIGVFCTTFGPNRPVVYRTTDFKSNEYRNLKHGSQFEIKEENPMIGYRGVTRYVVDPDVFELELSAIKKVRQKMGMRNLYVMLPFVRTPENLVEAKRIMAGVGLVRTPSFKLWIMVEIPTNVIRIDDFIKAGIDGVSIGSNDLTQLILGVDRDNEKIAHIFSERDPAVLWALEKTVTSCCKYNITCSLCGQAASDYPDLVEKLVSWGITSVSVNADAVEKTRLAVYRAEQKQINRRSVCQK